MGVISLGIEPEVRQAVEQEVEGDVLRGNSRR